MNRACNKKHLRGFSLLEVMIALIVSNVALLGLVAGELKSLQYANNSYQYTVSLIQANNVVERVLNDVCLLKGNTFSSAYIDRLTPIEGYELTWGNISPDTAFIESFTVYVSWQDKRMDDQSANKVALMASFPTVPPGCSVNDA